MMTLTPESDRTPAPTIGDELEREALTIGSTMQLFLRLRWWLVAVGAVATFAWKGSVTTPPAAAQPSLELEQKVDRMDRNVNSLVKLACLQYGPTSIEIAMSDISCPSATPGAEHTAARIRR